MRRSRTAIGWLRLLAALVVVTMPAPTLGALGGESKEPRRLVGAGDEAWGQRAHEVDAQGRASPAPIQRAIGSYRKALELSPQHVGTHWRLVRALHYAGTFVRDTEEVRRKDLERARDRGEAGLDEVARGFAGGRRLEDLSRAELLERVALKDRHDVAALYFWSALAWGAWAREAGAVQAVLGGVVDRLHAYSGVVLVLEPSYETGGMHRLRAHLHGDLPRVPLLTGWVDRDQAVPEARAALAIDPTERGNQVVYAMALLATRDGQRAEALEVLRKVVALPAREENLAEDLAIRKLSQETLVEQEASAPGAS